MNRRNYQRELNQIIDRQGDRRMRVLLHCCCGPCSSAVLEYLTQFFDLTLLWYNPNIYPREEFDRRRAALEELVDKMGLSGKVAIRLEDWRSTDYASRVIGLEQEPEGGARCTECFRLRLEETARLAAREGFDCYCSTLTLSRHKDALRINRLGEEIGARFGIRWLPSDFKKQGREDRSVELCRQYGIYRQLYCGCRFSLERREAYAGRTGEGKDTGWNTPQEN